MATLRVTRGYTFVAGVVPEVDDYNAAAMPVVEFDEGVSAEDIADKAIGPVHLADDIFSGLTEVSSFATGDSLPLYDLSGAINGRVTGATLASGLFSFGAAATSFTGFATDLVTFHNGTAAVTMPVSRFVEQTIGQATELTATADEDTVLVSDASAAAGAKAVRVTLANLLPDKITAKTYNGVKSMKLDAKGRVVELVEPSGSESTTTKKFASTLITIPTAGSSITPVAHNLGAKPSIVFGWLVCTANDKNYRLDSGDGTPDEIPLFNVIASAGGNFDGAQCFGASANKTYIELIRGNTATLQIYDRLTGAATPNLDEAKWKIRLEAWL